jgi:hypothetical protein
MAQVCQCGTVTRVYDLLELANKTEVARRLKRKGYELDERTFLRWVAERRQMEPRMARDIEAMFAEAGREETAPPEWAERLLVGIVALERKGQITADELARARAEVLVYLAAGNQKLPRRGGGGGKATAAS